MQKTVVATAMIKHNSNVSWSSFLKTLLAKLQQKLVHPQNFMPKYHLETEEKIKIKMDRYSEFKFNSAGVRMTTKTRRQSFTTMPPCDYTTIRLLTDDYWHWTSRNSRFLKVFYPCTKFPINSVKMDLICKSKKETTKTQFGIFYIYILRHFDQINSKFLQDKTFNSLLFQNLSTWTILIPIYYSTYSTLFFL